MDLEDIMLSEISQKVKYSVITYIQNLKSKQMNDTTKQKHSHRYRELVVSSGEREGERGKIGVGD